jgi:L-alanine-DL-glutamate epimerase-like enolase superfamily enzyme
MEAEVMMARFQLSIPFVTAHGRLEYLDRVFIRLTDGTCEGWGEAVANFPYDDFDAFDCWVELKWLARRLDGHDLISLSNQLQLPPSRAALDSARLDLAARRAGTSVVDLLGLETYSGAGLHSIGFLPSEELVAEVQQAVKAGLIPKLKLGRGLKPDREAVRAALSALPRDGRFAADANGAYDPEGGGALIDLLTDNVDRVLLVEQPVAARYGIAALAALAARVPFPIVADESAVDRAAVLAAADSGVAVNLKLTRLGGLTEAVQLARVVGVGVMIGGTFGSPLQRAFDRIALGGPRHLLPSDAVMSAEAYFPGSEQAIVRPTVDGLGVGVAVNTTRLRALAIDPHVVHAARAYNGYQSRTGRDKDWNKQP